MKTIGAKVDDSVYLRIKKLGNVSDIVRSAIFDYLRNHENIANSLVNHEVNQKNEVEGYNDINNKVDCLISNKK